MAAELLVGSSFRCPVRNSVRGENIRRDGSADATRQRGYGAMIGKLTLAAGLVALGTLATTPTASAAAFPQSRPAIDADTSVVHQVHRRHHRFHRHRFVYFGAGPNYCSVWRHRCAHRWGWRTRGFFHCLWRHGC